MRRRAGTLNCRDGNLVGVVRSKNRGPSVARVAMSCQSAAPRQSVQRRTDASETMFGIAAVYGSA